MKVHPHCLHCGRTFGEHMAELDAPAPVCDVWSPSTRKAAA